MPLKVIWVNALLTALIYRQKQAPCYRSRATLGPTSKNWLQGMNKDVERLIDAKHMASIGTWSIRTLWKDGSLKLLVDHFNKWFRWDVIGLSEVRRTKQGIVEHAGHGLLYLSEEKKHQGGVVLLLSKKASKSLIDWNPV